MKSKKVLTIIVTLLIVGFSFLALRACDDTVISKYETYEQAKKDRLFGRGWLPDIIPASSTKINVSSDLDLNISEGDFYFAPSDANQFISKLKPSDIKPKPELIDQGYISYEYMSENGRWNFFVQSAQGHAIYNYAHSRQYE